MTLRIQLALAGGLALAAAFFFAWRAPDAYPLDDAYIHFAYADNLAAGRGLIFEAPGETSVGSTSILWVLLLAVTARLGLPALVAARALGVLAHVACAGLTGAIVHSASERWRARWLPLAAGGLVALCGPLAWFALSGMETLLFAALGLAALLAYRAGRQGWLGLFLGLTCLTRPEGAALGLAVALAAAWQSRRPPLHQLWRPGLIALALAAPWFLYLYARTGDVLPGSYYGKQFTQHVAIDYFTSRAPWLAALADVRPLVFAVLSAGYWFLFYWGGAYLPGPGLHLPLPLERSGLALLAVPVMILWLALLGRGVMSLWRQRGQFQAADRSAWLAFGLWIVIHNAAFSLFLPAPGTASRYIAVDYIFMAAGVALGLAPTAEASRRSRTLLQAAAAVVAAVTAGTVVYWRTVYVSSVRQVAEVRITMAEQIDEIAPPRAVVAAFDIGVLEYYLPQPVVDLGGLTDNRVLDYVAAGQVGRYLCAVRAAYLVAPESNSASGASFYDYLDSLGLRSDPDLELTELTRMAMDEDAWRVGGTTTGNSTAAVLLYRVDRKCEQDE